jgi:hypothetical protein
MRLTIGAVILILVFTVIAVIAEIPQNIQLLISGLLGIIIALIVINKEKK